MRISRIVRWYTFLYSLDDFGTKKIDLRNSHLHSSEKYYTTFSLFYSSKVWTNLMIIEMIIRHGNYFCSTGFLAHVLSIFRRLGSAGTSLSPVTKSNSTELPKIFLNGWSWYFITSTLDPCPWRHKTRSGFDFTLNDCWVLRRDSATQSNPTDDMFVCAS